VGSVLLRGGGGLEKPNKNEARIKSKKRGKSIKNGIEIIHEKKANLRACVETGEETNSPSNTKMRQTDKKNSFFPD